MNETSEQKKITPSPAMLAEWAKDTDLNLHSDVRIKIATWAARNKPDGRHVRFIPFETFAEGYGKVKWLIDHGLCYKGIMDYRGNLDDALLNEIENVYGADVRQMIDKCL